MKHNYHHLEIWKLGLELADSIYELTEKFPQKKSFAMVDQLIRASISVPSNIAEGCGRGTVPQLKHFLDITVGSLAELETQLYICQGRKFVSKSDSENIIAKITMIRRMTLSFKKSLGNS